MDPRLGVTFVDRRGRKAMSHVLVSFIGAVVYLTEAGARSLLNLQSEACCVYAAIW